jgi:hypothetical protein
MPDEYTKFRPIRVTISGLQFYSDIARKKTVFALSRLFTNNIDLGSIIGIINQKINGFVAPGSHAC